MLLRLRSGHVWRCLLFVCLLGYGELSHAESPATSAAPEIVSVEKIWDAGGHNAFTDLIRFRDKWFCTFREADGHIVGDGKIRVIESADGKSWTSVALLDEKGIDLRDPKLSITPDGRLMLVMGGSDYAGTNVGGQKSVLKVRQPRVAFSSDGHEWSAPQRVLDEGDWLWRVTWHDGRAYGVTYDIATRAKTGPQDDPPGLVVQLVTSTDGVTWERRDFLEVPDRPNETTLRFLPDGEMAALVRRESGSKRGWIGSSRPPYEAWSWRETAHQVGGPNFIVLPDGQMWAVVRTYPGGAKTTLARMTRDSLEPVLTLPSGGDTSYAGLAWHDGLLWVSYYSKHQDDKANIYLAKIKLPGE